MCVLSVGQILLQVLFEFWWIITIWAFLMSTNYITLYLDICFYLYGCCCFLPKTKSILFSYGCNDVYKIQVFSFAVILIGFIDPLLLLWLLVFVRICVCVGVLVSWIRFWLLYSSNNILEMALLFFISVWCHLSARVGVRTAYINS